MKKPIRICIWCGKKIPNHRQKRATTCSKKCVNDWSHASSKKREEMKQKWKK